MSSGLWWGFWSDYPKTTVDGREYARDRQSVVYPHAVEPFAPSGRRSVGDVPGPGRKWRLSGKMLEGLHQPG